MIPWRGRCFQIVKENEKLLWPEYPKAILNVYSEIHSSDKPIQVVDKKGNVEYYPNITRWCKEDRDNRCDPAVLSRHMRKNKGKEFRWRDWVFSYIDLSRYPQNIISKQLLRLTH